VISPILANVYLHYVFDLRVRCLVIALTPEPEAEPGAFSSARRDLCEGRGEILVPTATVAAWRSWIARKPETHLFSTEACSIALSWGSIANAN
jgi:hypothetical protein